MQINFNKKIAGKEEAILIQNAFPTIEKYVQSIHEIAGNPIKISSAVKKNIIDCFNLLIIIFLEFLYLDISGINEVFNAIIKNDGIVKRGNT